MLCKFLFSKNISLPQIGHPTATDTRFDIQFQNMNLGNRTAQTNVHAEPGMD